MRHKLPRQTKLLHTPSEIIRSILGNNEPQLETYLDFLADDIDFLSERYADRWGITLHKSGVRLNVGWVECLVLHTDGLNVLVETASCPSGFRKRDWKYRLAPGCPMVSVPFEGLQSSLRALRRTHKAALAIAAKRPTNATIRAAHSSAMVDFTAWYLGRKLANPAYVAPPLLAPVPDIDEMYAAVEGRTRFVQHLSESETAALSRKRRRLYEPGTASSAAKFARSAFRKNTGCVEENFARSIMSYLSRCYDPRLRPGYKT